ncbi:hypothetical protein L1987_56673 [Smallanthus sonchifolius]|uniref:Uncharacterized protein n=1 Tax=Smallanthus sonchifolius TaxID=185202 RepID=A0ACB9EDT2_9ASTR|nr:hypothetical protein L1987_56673 [Smallanthus sonchifolius]
MSVYTLFIQYPMLFVTVSAIEQLQVMASKRKYKEAAAQVELPQMLFNGKYSVEPDHAEESNLLQQLSDACLVVDALEPSVREELVKNFCNRELISYQQIFEGAELAKLDKTERRYAWVKRRLRTNEEIWKTFPASWHVDYLFVYSVLQIDQDTAYGDLSKLEREARCWNITAGKDTSSELFSLLLNLISASHSPFVLVIIF